MAPSSSIDFDLFDEFGRMTIICINNRNYNNMHITCLIIRKRLLTGIVTVNNLLLTGTERFVRGEGGCK